MNQKTKNAISITAAVTFAALAVKSRQSYNNDLYDRYPDLHRKMVRRAFNMVMYKAMTGKYDMSHWSDAKMDEFFMIEYNKIADKK